MERDPDPDRIDAASKRVARLTQELNDSHASLLGSMESVDQLLNLRIETETEIYLQAKSVNEQLLQKLSNMTKGGIVEELNDILEAKKEELGNAREELGRAQETLRRQQAKLLTLLQQKENHLKTARLQRVRAEQATQSRLNLYISIQKYLGIVLATILGAVIASRFL
eukprot:TRINITY_DN12153_c0_g1_i1.p1 TRINITY_DN12153_c0_g1~~TRINITY_DN12153_c0_g1_i1.p1  ORF type:complete len:168 (-),score=24.23 TRINITY_DN12153_c0_g1_i1:26-529(-)